MNEAPGIRCLLVDDEFLALALLEKYVNEEPGLVLTGKCKNPVQAVEILNTQSVDLLFLDIQMPLMSGISLLKNISSKPVTIFTTAYTQYAYEAFDLDAVDYLTKPFSRERFRQAIRKATNLLSLKNKDSGADLPVISGEMTVKSDRKYVKVAFSDILFVEGWKEYVKIHTLNGKIITLESMNNMELILPDTHFYRVHKSYIVSIPRVRQFEDDTLIIGDSRIPVSKARKKEVISRIFTAP
ncbi:MAG: LytR/AlgR family response regulator transcription factor [Bacteroidota bacterium]